MCVGLLYSLSKERWREEECRNVEKKDRKEAVDHVMKVDSEAYSFDGAEQLIADIS